MDGDLPFTSGTTFSGPVWKELETLFEEAAPVVFHSPRSASASSPSGDETGGVFAKSKLGALPLVPEKKEDG